MSFKGQTYRLAFSEGGFNGGINYDLVPKTAFVAPSRNLNLQNGVREKRGGTTKINSTVITAAPKCLGIGQLIPKSGAASVILSAHSDGKIWKDEASAIKTGMSQTNRFDFCSVGDTVMVCDGATIPQVYTAAGAIANINEPATDWSGSNYPKFMISHGRGVSRRVMAFGVPTFQDSFYCSGSGTYEKFVTGVLKFTVETGDGFGVVAAIEASSGDVVMFGKRKTYIFQDSDTNTANWGWYKAPWNGGAAHQKLVIKAENEIYAMMDDGEIYSLSAASQLNDYKLASVTRQAFIHTYIKNNVDLSKIAEFHCSYEPNEKCVYWWVVRTGQTTADTALKFYPDRAVHQTTGMVPYYGDCWSIDDGTDNSVSGIRATASNTLRNSDGSYSLVTGDSSGFLWKIAQTAKSDDGNGYTQVCRTPWLNLDLPRNEKRFVSAELVFVVNGAYPVTVRWFVDDAEQTSQNTTLAGQGSVFPLSFGTSVFAAPGLNQVSIPLGQVGRRIMFDFSNSNAGQSLLLSQVNIDFVDRGPRYL